MRPNNQPSRIIELVNAPRTPLQWAKDIVGVVYYLFWVGLIVALLGTFSAISAFVNEPLPYSLTQYLIAVSVVIVLTAVFVLLVDTFNES